MVNSENESSRGPRGSVAGRRWSRVEGSGSAARAVAWVLWGGWVVGIVAVRGWNGLASLDTWIYLAPALFFLLRSSWFGVYIGAGEIRIVSWLYTYHVARADVDAVVVRIYNGFLIRWSGGLDIFSSRVQMIGFERKSGKRKLYPGTAMTNRRAKAVSTLLSEELGVPRTVASYLES